MDARNDRLDQTRREALWKWRWLGWRDSTPAFKGSLVLIAIAAAIIAVAAFR